MLIYAKTRAVLKLFCREQNYMKIPWDLTSLELEWPWLTGHNFWHLMLLYIHPYIQKPEHKLTTEISIGCYLLKIAHSTKVIWTCSDQNVRSCKNTFTFRSVNCDFSSYWITTKQTVITNLLMSTLQDLSQCHHTLY